MDRLRLFRWSPTFIGSQTGNIWEVHGSSSQHFIVRSLLELIQVWHHHNSGIFHWVDTIQRNLHVLVLYTWTHSWWPVIAIVTNYSHMPIPLCKQEANKTKIKDHLLLSWTSGLTQIYHFKKNFKGKWYWSHISLIVLLTGKFLNYWKSNWISDIKT